MELFRLFGTIMIDDQDAIKTLRNTEKQASGTSKSLSGMAKTTVAVGAAIVGMATAAGAAMYGMASKIANATSEISDNSKQVGMSAEEWQKWKYAAGQTGVEVSKMNALMIKQQSVFSDAKNGAKSASKVYQELGIDITKIGTSSEAFDVVMSRLAGMTNETDRNRIAQDIFGKSYADLLPLLSEGADGMNALRSRAEELGIVMSNEAVDSGDKLGDTLDDLKASFESIGNKILIKLMPTFQKIADWILLHQDDIAKFADDVLKGIGDAIDWIADNSDWLIPVLGILLGAFLAFQAVSAINVIIGIFNALLLANPVGLFIAAAAGLVTILVLLVKNWDNIRKATQKAIDKTLEFFGLKQKTTTNNYSTNLDEGGNTGSAFGGVSGGHWATGGIFTKPTFLASTNGPALVGEAGVEAVLPLSKLPGLIGDTIDYGKLETSFRRALSGQRIIMDEDGFATFVDSRIVKAGY